MAAPLGFTVHGPVVRRDAAWRLVGDTDWLNRVGGNSRVLSLGVTLDGQDYPAITGEMEGPARMRLSFEETDVSWVSGSFFRQVRVFSGRILARTAYEARLEPEGDGVRPVIHLEVEPGMALLRPVTQARIGALRRRWEAALAGLPAPGQQAEEPLLRELPRAAREAFDRWGRAVPPELVGLFEQHLRRARPVELTRIRPFELADRWGRPREEVLTAALEGVLRGALELYWSVRCTSCHGTVAQSVSLSALTEQARCDSCRLAFETDLGGNVEVLFAPHPAVAARAEERFCTLFPMAAPELRALFVLQPGATVDAAVPVEPGRWKLEAGAGSPRVTIDMDGGEGSSLLTWSATGDDLAARGGAGPLTVRLENPGSRRVRVHLSRAGVAQDRVLASALTTMPAFRRQMGHQVLSPSLRIAVRQVGILFTDLTGSTALYEQLGDAGAFAFVRDHFDLLREVTEEHGGVVVKTIGDGAMAAFNEPHAAVACALAALGRFEAWSRRLELAHACDLKVGAHAGPALVVHSDSSGIDYFGATVNMAARAQGQAGPGELVLTARMADDPAVERVLVSSGLARRSLDVTLKGVSGVQSLVCVGAGPQPR